MTPSITSSFAIVGAGAIGLNYGVRLALAGADVRFLVRGDPVPLRTGGLRVIEKADGIGGTSVRAGCRLGAFHQRLDCRALSRTL